MQIKEQVLKRLQEDVGVRGRLCAATRKSYETIWRWCQDNNEGLTLASALKVIREEYGLTDEEILEEVTKHVA